MALHVLLMGLLLTLGSPSGLSSGSALLGTSHPPILDRWAQETSQDTLPVRWVLDSRVSEARYRVREQLAGFDFPNDAVGATSDLTGTILLAPDGSIIPEGSEFRIQLASLTTDNERRDGYVQRRTLEVQEYPEAVLIPRQFVDLPNPLPETGTVSFQLEADLTLHGETRPTVWEMTAEFGTAEISGFATTHFPFNTFGISVPQVARVLSVEDNIRLELDFKLVPGESNP